MCFHEGSPSPPLTAAGAFDAEEEAPGPPAGGAAPRHEATDVSNAVPAGVLQDVARGQPPEVPFHI